MEILPTFNYKDEKIYMSLGVIENFTKSAKLEEGKGCYKLTLVLRAYDSPELCYVIEKLLVITGTTSITLKDIQNFHTFPIELESFGPPSIDVRYDEVEMTYVADVTLPNYGTAYDWKANISFVAPQSYRCFA